MEKKKHFLVVTSIGQFIDIIYILCIIYVFCVVLMMGPVKKLDWSPAKRVTRITLEKEGYSYREVAAKVGCGVSASGVQKLCKRFEISGSVQTQVGKERKKLPTPKTQTHCQIGSTKPEIIIH